MRHHSATVFAVLAAAALLAAQQSAPPSRAAAAGPQAIALKYASVDPARGEPAVPPGLRADAADVEHFLVQIGATVDEANKQALRDRGLVLLDYVPERAWIVRASAAQVARCAAAGAITWSSPLHPAYRIDPALLDGPVPARVAVLGFLGVDRATLRAQIAAAGGVVAEEHEQIDRWLMLVPATPGIALALARCRDVQWVEPESLVTTRNDTMTWSVQTAVSGNRRIWTAGLRGEGQIIGHMDGAIATSSCFFADPTNPIGPSHRKIVYTSGTGAANTHGTHTAGTAAGDPFPVNGTTTARGLAYAAKIAHSNNYSAAAWNSLAIAHRTAGARLHTNSWGNDGTTAYNSHCNAIDAFSWTYEDNLVLFAETNTSTLKNPENAKNLVAVGNAQNGAGYMNKGGGGVGPTSDGRRKPDLFAPGTSIVSASTAACATTSLTGTSMACPAATAAGALIRQYFVDGFYPTGAATPANAFVPTGALVKAVMINTCQDMTGVAAAVPNTTEGWGRLVLDETLHFSGDLGRMWVADVRRANGLVTGGQRTFTVDVASAARPLEITMAFTDFAGAVNAAAAAVNNLNLEVTAPNGAVFLGNAFSGGFSIAGGAADAINNVERVAVAAPAVGTWTIRVVGAAVPQGPCGYALCASGDLGGGFGLASVATYGAGKPGTLGVPSITGTLPTIPSSWTLSGSLTVSNAFGIVVQGDAPAALPFDGGTVLANPLLLDVVLTGPLPGNWTYPVAIPNTAALNGVSTYWQFWMPNDPVAAGGNWAASPGLRMTIGN
ncbi:MAG: S8 family serine peptidase [Planctomycetota bacterium]